MPDCTNSKIWPPPHFNVFETGIRFAGDGTASLCLLSGGNCHKVVVTVRSCVNIITTIHMASLLPSYVHCWNCPCFNFHLKCLTHSLLDSALLLCIQTGMRIEQRDTHSRLVKWMFSTGVIIIIPFFIAEQHPRALLVPSKEDTQRKCNCIVFGCWNKCRKISHISPPALVKATELTRSPQKDERNFKTLRGWQHWFL